jgi:endonuclease V-like protein UPF0215 family
LKPKPFRSIKREIRVLGVDDGVFVPHVKGSALVVGAVFRGGCWLDGVVHTSVEVDGFDAADKISKMVLASPHYKQLRVIMLDGVTFAGFNVVNIKVLEERTKLPVIAVTRDKPNLDEIQAALENLSYPEKRWNAFVHAGQIIAVSTRRRNEKVYMCASGISEKDAVRIMQMTSTRSNIPEPLRVAHLIASGVTSEASESQSVSQQEKV